MSKVEQEVLNTEFLGQFFKKELEFDIPEQLKALRRMRGVSQEKLAEKAGINQPAISRMEREFKEGQKIDDLLKLAEALGARLHILLEPYELAAARVKVEDKVKVPPRPRIMPKDDSKKHIVF
jgi:transcriptional regulator with XRE-family HTH domain